MRRAAQRQEIEKWPKRSLIRNLEGLKEKQRHLLMNIRACIRPAEFMPEGCAMVYTRRAIKKAHTNREEQPR